jgi:hypothetical protein
MWTVCAGFSPGAPSNYGKSQEGTVKILHVLALVCLVAMMAASANASDFVFGGQARSVAMGGAGLALTDDVATGSMVNPATPAVRGTKFRFIFPSIDVHTRGASLSDLLSRTSEVSNGNEDSALQLAKDFSKGPTTLSLGFATGFAGTTGLTVEGEAQGVITPGVGFTQWVNAGAPITVADLIANAGKFTDPTLIAHITAAIPKVIAGTFTAADMAVIANDLTGGSTVTAQAVYSFPAIAYSKRMGSSGWFVGTKMKWMHSESHTWDLNQKNPLTATSVNIEATENVALQSKKSSFGADLGLIYAPSPNLRYAVVVDNFIKPNLRPVETPTMWSMGFGYQPIHGVTFAADLFNLNKAYGDKCRLRLGAEARLGSILAFRAGHNGDAFTYGFRVFGFDFAFTSKQARLFSRSFGF